MPDFYSFGELELSHKISGPMDGQQWAGRGLGGKPLLGRVTLSRAGKVRPARPGESA